MKRTLQDWLSWQESLHYTEIDLGLERIGAVAKRLNILKPKFPIITVAGTNGKGSTVAFLEEMLRAQGYKTGAYTSPHLIHYNERICLNGEQATDADIIEAFEKIDAARFYEDEQGKKNETSLSYFEFSTLSAILCFKTKNIDIGILEVGLGGRLDATNLWNTSLAIITSIGIDHVDWLGDDREIIAVEKSGIMRKNIPVICGDQNPPANIAKEAQRIGARLVQINTDFKYEALDDHSWVWSDNKQSLNLPLPAMAGDFQLNNAATAIAALRAINTEFAINNEAITIGLESASVDGRLQILQHSPEWLIDVAHNPHAAKQLAQYLNKHAANGKTYALFSILKDKDIQQVLTIMNSSIDEWHIVGLNGPRGLSINELKQQFKQQNITKNINSYDTFKEACVSLKNIIKVEDRVVAFGSFLVVSELLESCEFNKH